MSLGCVPSRNSHTCCMVHPLIQPSSVYTTVATGFFVSGDISSGGPQNICASRHTWNGYGAWSSVLHKPYCPLPSLLWSRIYQPHLRIHMCVGYMPAHRDLLRSPAGNPSISLEVMLQILVFTRGRVRATVLTTS